MAQKEVSKLPRHVAIIMDGNGRWARRRALPRIAGHKKGIESLRRAVSYCVKKGIKTLSVYVFSTENWRRPKGEVQFLMNLFNDLIEKEVKDLHKNNVKVKFSGQLSELSPELQKKIADSELLTEKNQALTLNIMINYGARQEIVEAVKELYRNIAENSTVIEDLTPELFQRYLYTKDSPDPELLIRTGGEYRLSNFMLWQLSYAEFYVTDVFWPDFDEEEFEKAISWYNERERRFGGLVSDK